MEIDFKKVKKVYLLGIGGVGMGNLAGMLKESGKVVSGSDRQIYSPMKEYLEGIGVDLKIGFKPENLKEKPDLVIVGNVITRDNPEAQEMLRQNIPFVSMPEAIREFFLKDRKVIVIAGTHGKTTTTALLGWLLYSSGRSPGVLLGGVSKNFNSGFFLGGGEYFVIEGDEYDTAFFDKGPKFLHYHPRILVLTTIEFDHGDIYRDLDAVKGSFRRLVQTLPPDGFIVYGSYSDNVRDVINSSFIPSVSAGEQGFWDYREVVFKDNYTEFTVIKDKKIFGRFKWKMWGLHNIRNALLAMAVAEYAGLQPEEIARGLLTFEGVKRRQEIIGEFNGVLLIDDFAHHPTEVRETISAVKKRYPDRRIWAVFEPRSNTSRRRFFQDLYPGAFMEADCIIISDVFNKNAIEDGFRLAPEKIVEELQKRGKKAEFIASPEGIVKFLKDNTDNGDVVLVMSNGSFGGLIEMLKQTLSGNST